MAKRRRKGRKSHRTGSVIVTRRLSGTGLGNVKNTKSALGALLPPLVGGALAGLGTIGLEMLAEPKAGEAQSDTQKFLADWAPWLGIAVGGAGSLAMAAMVGAPQGVAALAGAVGVGGALGVRKLMQETAPTTSGYRRRMGAIVPQRSPLGAIVMTPVATNVRGPYQAMGESAGAVVQLGKVNTNAFGTPGFNG